MNIKKIIICLIVLTVFISCRKRINCYGDYEDVILPIKIVNTNGQNLLNNGFDIDSIQIYYLYEDGCVILCNKPGLDISKGFLINGDLIGIVLEDPGHEHNGNIYNIPFSDKTLYIKWNSQDTDTIFTKYARKRPSIDESLPGGYCTFDVYNEVYYNGKLIVSSWEDNQEKMSQGIYPTIIKE